MWHPYGSEAQHFAAQLQRYALDTYGCAAVDEAVEPTTDSAHVFPEVVVAVEALSIISDQAHAPLPQTDDLQLTR